MSFFFLQAHADIDWSHGYTFLDTELRQIMRDAELGKRLADKLVQVWTHDGERTWVLIHIEVQSQEETAFAQRMYSYHYRIFDRYQRDVVSLAVLGDESTIWRPDTYQQTRWGCRLSFTFPTAKLLDYRAQWATLERSRNPFATVVMAHLKAQETRHDADQRGVWKFTLVRRLYELGYDRQDVLNLFRVIDWLMGLPKAQTARFWQDVHTYEEEHQMAYVTSIEQLGIEKGLQQGIKKGREEGLRQGLLDGIALALELKYGSAHPLLPRVLEELREIEAVESLKTVQAAIRTAATLEELRQVYAAGEA